MTRMTFRPTGGWRGRFAPRWMAAAALLVVALCIGIGLSLVERRPAPEVAAMQMAIAETPRPAEPAPQAADPMPRAADPAPPSDRNDEPQQALLAVPLPVAPSRPSGEPAWLRYAVTPPPTNGNAMVAVVFDDVGLDRKGADEAIRLPGPLTISFMTYANDLARMTAAAHAAGHEIMLHVPMEPLDAHNDPGPNVLLTSLSREEILRRLRWGLDRATGYVGINNHMGSKFTSSAESMAPVLEEVKARGLLFLDSRTAPNATGEQVARQLGVPHAGRDVFLDNEGSATAIAARLADLEQIARRHGSAIAIGHPHETTIAAVSAWLPTLAAKHLVLVPLSAIVRQRGATG
jgi:polysaccharide deacetylase 2 family uncharacterized protein YibQ